MSGDGWSRAGKEENNKSKIVGAREDKNMPNFRLQNQLLKHFSSLANSVLALSAKFLSTTFDKLCNDFEETYLGPAKDHLAYARSLLEHCCFKALAQLTQQKNYLHDADFRRFSFDFMVAWEKPFSSETDDVKDENEKRTQKKDEADEDTALFFSDLMPLLVEVENTVQVEAFVQIAPRISILADSISVYPQFETLTASTSGRLPFPIYEKYIEALEICFSP